MIEHKLLLTTFLYNIDVRNAFTFFIIFVKKRVFKVFLFLERFLFLSSEIFYPTKSAKILLSLLNSCIKRLLSDGLNMTFVSYENSLMKSCRAYSLQKLSCILKL